MSNRLIQAVIHYEDRYVQPLILSALRSQLPAELVDIIESDIPRESQTTPTLQWKSYETLNFDQALESRTKQLINAYVIRKALIRKHYLSHTVHAWVVKNPDSALQKHFPPAVDFELDYAEFLDDALVEAFELRDAFEKNASLDPAERQWWILKPGMSDRGQGIRLFSTEEELTGIFESWEAAEPDSEDDDAVSDPDATADGSALAEGIVTSHLRHFVAQPYIHPPLLAAQAPFDNRKFHIRTYAVASGALRAYVHDDMLALFASEPYTPPWESAPPAADADVTDALEKMRNVHLSNTCVQTAPAAQKAASVFLLDSLPFSASTLSAIKQQIRATTRDLFRAALAQPVHFQALPQAFEIFGLDFLVSAGAELDPRVWLLEVNAFPDFAQTGDELKDKVVGGLFEQVVRCVAAPYFGMGDRENVAGSDTLKLVLDTETGLK